MDRAPRSSGTTREDELGVQEEGSPAPGVRNDTARLDALFAPEVSAEYRARWNEVQSAFVDDPRSAVERGDELVAEVMESLQQSFAAQREDLAGELDRSAEASTESLRIMLRSYRSFFERLLSV